MMLKRWYVRLTVGASTAERMAWLCCKASISLLGSSPPAVKTYMLLMLLLKS